MMKSLFILAVTAISASLDLATGFQQQQLISSHRQNLHSRASTSLTCPLPPANSIANGSPTGSSSTTQLNALPTLSSSPLGALAVLAGIVVVHESGHYLAARAFNITVEEFSVGFGPKLAGFDAFGNEFNLRALPLGGFVRFPENYDGKAYIEIEDLKVKAKMAVRKNKKEAKEWNLPDNLLDYATLGYWTERKLEEWRTQNRAEREEAKKPKGSFFSRMFGGDSTGKSGNKKDSDDLDINEVYQNLDELDAYEVEYYDDPQLLQNRPWQERAVVLSGGVIFNLILALSIYFAAIGPLPVGSSEGLPRAVFGDGVVVAQAPQTGGPSNGVLRQGDIITGINGQPIEVSGSQKTSVAAGQKQVTDVISTIRATPDGESVSVKVLRDQSETTLKIQPQRADGSNVQSIGVMLSPRLDRLERLKSDNPFVAFSMAWDYLSDIFTQTLLGTLSVLTSFVSSSGPPPGQKISGPIGLLSQGSSVVATKDWTAVLMFAAGLSVNLGVINALPLPALDGGQLVFVIAEALTGKKVDQKVQERVTSLAVLFLLWVSLNAAIGDVGNLFR